MSKILPACVGAGLLGLVGMPASAELSAADRDFAMNAASGGMAEVHSAAAANGQARD